MADDRKYIGARFPRLFPGSARYLVDGQPSGAVGAIAEVPITIDSYPQAITRISVQHVYQVADGVVQGNPAVYQGLRAIDDDAEIEIVATQQNITARPVALATLQGRNLEVPLPLAAPYLLKGLNQVTVRLRRLTGYPALGEQAILPVAYVTLSSVAIQSDLAPGAIPPQSSGRWGGGV